MSVTFNNNIGVVRSQLQGNIRKALDLVGAHAVRRTVEIISEVGYYGPGDIVDTGALRASIAHQPYGPTAVEIGSPLDYSSDVHEGTARMPGRPYQRDAVMNYLDEYKEIIEGTLPEGF